MCTTRFPAAPTAQTSPLYRKITRAAGQDDVALAHRILGIDAVEVDAGDSDSSIPLRRASGTRHADGATKRLHTCAATNVRERIERCGDPPLPAAACANQRSVDIFLLARRAQVRATTPAAQAPPDETVVHNATAVAKLLRQV